MTPDGQPAYAHLFGVPFALVTPVLPSAVVDKVIADLLSERSRCDGLSLSNVGGWHSRTDLSGRDDPALAAVLGAVLTEVDRMQHSMAAPAGAGRRPVWRYAVQAWAMVMSDGDYGKLHDHAEAHWSFVHYLDTGDADRALHPCSGMIAWTNPARPPNGPPGLDYSPRLFELSPQAGQLVIFPGWLPHFVHPYRGCRPRVCIAGNVRVEGVGDPARS